VSVAWPQVSPAGEFRAAYRVVSADGHPIEGSITFTVGTPVGPDTTGPVAVAAEPSESTGAPDSSVSPEAAAPDVPVESPSPTSESPTDDGGNNLLAWVIGLGVAVLIGAGAGTWVMRHTR